METEDAAPFANTGSVTAAPVAASTGNALKVPATISVKAAITSRTA